MRDRLMEMLVAPAVLLAGLLLFGCGSGGAELRSPEFKGSLT